jgi:hypothetical protein
LAEAGDRAGPFFEEGDTSYGLFIILGGEVA